VKPAHRWRGAWLALAGGVLCTIAAAQARDGDDAAARADKPTAGQRADPWEGFNRAMFAVNQEIDKGLLIPITSAYVGLVPDLVRTGVSNVFNNAADLWSAANQLMQGKLERATIMSMRFVTNSVFGVAGILDIATELGMERMPEDFGQTLGYWGMPAGNYLVLPFFGPSTVRDAIGLPFDIAASPAYAINQGSFRPLTTALQIVDLRAPLLPAMRVLDEIALDKYSFVRDAYLSRRLNMVFDGNPPEDYEEAPAKALEDKAPAKAND
jgi:phospholipid-binding lipoprotein MlaA